MEWSGGKRKTGLRGDWNQGENFSLRFVEQYPGRFVRGKEKDLISNSRVISKDG